MCMFNSPDIPAPQKATERAAERAPDNQAVNGAARRASDRARAGADTILTSGSGVTMTAPTEKKTLLGA